MTKTQISTLLGALAALLGVVLELLSVPGAGMLLGALAGALGVSRPSDTAEVRALRLRVAELERAGDPAPGSMDAEVHKILAAGVLD